VYYARVFEGYDSAKRTSAEQAIRSLAKLTDAIRGETRGN
jgi:hypothetical protein